MDLKDKTIVVTGTAQELGQKMAEIAAGQSANLVLADKIVSNIPLWRFVQPQEIARAVRFILQNDYYDGRILEIDGGLRL